MQRYTVAIVSPAVLGERPTLLVPFHPNALVTELVDELWIRIARQMIPLSPDTHKATLHLDSESGAIIQHEDVLSNVITDPKVEKIFAVITDRVDFDPSDTFSTLSTINGPPTPSEASTLTPGDEIHIRVITASKARTEQGGDVLTVQASATIGELQDKIAAHLSISPIPDTVEQNECNCKLAGLLADGPPMPGQVVVVRGKSEVVRFDLATPSESSLKDVLFENLGNDLETKKKINLVGAEFDTADLSCYKKPPVVAVCSKQRHVPAHARVDLSEDDRKVKALDLHTSELPIHPACMNCTIEDAGLRALYFDGAIDIYAVQRSAPKSTATATPIGKSSIYRSRAHWEPNVSQSERGMAMFLSSLRVFVSIVQDMRNDKEQQDAVLHVFDLFTKFPPALRTLHLLVQDKTPTSVESAALSQAVFETLDSFVPTAIIGTNHSRVFEGSRLLFGFILEKAKTLKLTPAQNEGEEDDDRESALPPYLSSFVTTDLRDCRTNEAVMHVVQTADGVVERCLFDAFQDNAVLAGSHLQRFMAKVDDQDDSIVRHALLSGGINSEIVAFSASNLALTYRYLDSGDIEAAFDVGELSELTHLAEISARHKLAVHKPNQLASAVAPCLTFDRNAHLAVYTGQQPCGTPGKSSMLFRPFHGEETIDVSIVEQLIAPILQTYESDGTVVFDALGGAVVRRLQAPDEIVMFCVDNSASMRAATDFTEVNEAGPELSKEPNAWSLVESKFYKAASFKEMKKRLCDYESFDDMVGMLYDASRGNRRSVAIKVLEILQDLLSDEIVERSESLDKKRQYMKTWFGGQQEIETLETILKDLKTFWAGLKTHEEAICDFLIYRGTSKSSNVVKLSTWSLGDPIPNRPVSQQISALPDDITDVPDHLICPISKMPMEDAVKAADGHTYSKSAISHWFTIRRSSPILGVSLSSSTLRPDRDVCDEVAAWINGNGLPGHDEAGTDTKSFMKRFRSSTNAGVRLEFSSREGSFGRSIAPPMTSRNLYTLVFRALKARYSIFQLSSDRYGTLSPTSDDDIFSRGIQDGDHITVRIPEESPGALAGSNTRSYSDDLCLVKVYGQDIDTMKFGYWVRRETGKTLASIIWKYWRYQFQRSSTSHYKSLRVWTGMQNSGDGLLGGSCQSSNKKLSGCLSTSQCFGRLSHEKVYKEDGYERVPHEPLVLKVHIGRPWRPDRYYSHLTRLDVLKQMFEALINRIFAYDYKTHVGLVRFSTTATVALPISHVLENFRRSAGAMVADGDTALWDALALSGDQLNEYGKKYPEAKKRIICISDGVDTKSVSNTSDEVCWRLRATDVAVDVVSLGSEKNLEIRTIPYMLGCYRFHPTSLVNALAICEMEPFLSLSERPTISFPRGHVKSRQFILTRFWSSRSLATWTAVNSDDMPPRKEHPNLYDGVVQLSSFAAMKSKVGAKNGPSNMRTLRLMKEIKQIVTDGPHPKYDIYVSEADMSFWKVVMDGPDESPYSRGTFQLYLHAEENYPTFAPKARYVTKIKHPNVNAHGRICHSIFDRDWTSDISMKTLLDTVYGLLYQPEHSDPVNTAMTLGFHHDQVEYAEEVRKHVAKHARKTRNEWKRELLDE